MNKLVKKYIKREIFDETAEHLEKPEITLITGSRQVGKTVIMEQLKRYLIKKIKIEENNIFYYNLDIVQDWEVFQSQTDFIKFLKDRSAKQKIFVFIDEAQKIPETATFFKGVYDSKMNVKLILTGSASFELKSKLKESLAGRKMVFNIMPFTFFEFLKFKDNFLSGLLGKNNIINKIDKSKIIDFYKEYITYGGYPRVVLSETIQEKINILKEIYSSYIEKDILGFLMIRNKTAFNRLIKLLAGQIGQLVNIEELAMNLAVDRQTIERYILALEQTFIIKKIVPYFTNARQEIIKSGKIYFIDLGIRNLVLENFNNVDERIDKGSVLENAVLNELLFALRNIFGKLRFWRTKQGAEVDFVIEKENILVPIEVKFTLKKNNIPSGMRNFTKKFNVKNGVIVNLSSGNNIIMLDKSKVTVIYPFEIRKFLN